MTSSRLPRWKNPKHLHFRAKPNATLKIGGKRAKGKSITIVRGFRAKEKPRQLAKLARNEEET